MTDLLSRPVVTGRGPERPSRSMVLAAVLSAAWSGVLSLALVAIVAVVAWAAAPTKGSAAAALHTAGALWLLGNGTPVSIAGVAVTLPALGLTAFLAFLFHRRGVILGRFLDIQGFRLAWATVGVVAVTHAFAAVLVALALSGSGVAVHPLAALAGGWILAAVATGTGVIRHPPLARRLHRRVPAAVRLAVSGATAGAACVCVLAALVAAGAVLAHLSRVSALASALDARPVGATALVLLQVAFLPDAVSWSAGYLVGPGFSVGAGTTYAAGHYLPGAVPAVPLLGALPGPAPSGVLVGGVLAVAAVGVVIGAFVAHRSAEVPWWRRLLTAGLAGIGAALLLVVGAALSHGAIGPGRMTSVGPAPLAVARWALAELGGGALVGSLVVLAWQQRATWGALRRALTIVEQPSSDA